MPKTFNSGKKKSHKGGHRHFTNEDDLAVEAEKARRQQEWRAKKGIESDEEDEGEEEKPVAMASKPGELPPSDNEEEGEEEEEEEDVEDKPKGVSHLIEIENPNRLKEKTKKITSLSIDGPTQETTLSRREREELEKQRAKENYQKMQIAGKTDEARADLARLALIRKQRDDAARKRDEERKAAEDAKTAAEQRLLDKKQKAGAGDKK